MCNVEYSTWPTVLHSVWEKESRESECEWKQEIGSECEWKQEIGSECEWKQEIGSQCETESGKLTVTMKERARNW